MDPQIRSAVATCHQVTDASQFCCEKCRSGKICFNGIHRTSEGTFDILLCKECGHEAYAGWQITYCFRSTLPWDREFHIGDTVKTDLSVPTHDWTEEALTRRKNGVTGVIVDSHDSHGECYDVRHEDGTIGCYEPSELQPTARVSL